MTYKSHCEWDGGYWVAVLDGVPGAVTQAKRLEQIPDRLVEVIKLMTGDTVSAEEIYVDARLGDAELDKRTHEVTDLQQQRDRIDHELHDKRYEFVVQLRKRGLPLRDIAALSGVSYQRVHQLLKG